MPDAVVNHQPRTEQDDMTQPAEAFEDQVLRIKTFPKDTLAHVIEAEIGTAGIRK